MHIKYITSVSLDYDVKMVLIEAHCNGMNWTQLAENAFHRLTSMLIMMNLQVSRLSSFDRLNNSNCPRDAVCEGIGSFRPSVQQVSTVIPRVTS
jgi:hypothetical protein